MTFSAGLVLISSCNAGSGTFSGKDSTVVQARVITQKVGYDSDDPAIWVNRADPSKSLVIGTDKDQNGALYVFDLKGNIVPEKTIKGLKRPNNVDLAYGFRLGGKAIDIAVTTERFNHKIRIFSVPDMKAVDNGGINVFEGETGDGFRDPMGIALYTAKDGKIYAIVGRKTGPLNGSYLWQYLLSDNGRGAIDAKLVRKFGEYSGKKEIESIAVDNELGYIYYSDEQYGVRQYAADPSAGNKQLSLFATTGFKEDHEGISIYKLSDTTGYILVSDQGANRFQLFAREGTAANPYEHKLLKVVNVSAQQSDGSEVVSVPLGPDFPHGMFVAMSTDRTFHFYRWEDIAGHELKKK